MEPATKKMKGQVQTVLGAIDPDALGSTLTHEHLLHSLTMKVFRKPLPSVIQHLHKAPMSMENLGWIRQYPYCFEENMEFCGEAVRDAVKEEMCFFKKSGGGTIVENSSVGLRPKNFSTYLKQLSKETGVNIVVGTGFYVNDAHDSNTLNMSEEEMEIKIKEDILEGMDGSDVKCGVIGEIGTSWPLLDFEKRSLVSAAIVQEDIGCPVIMHPGRNKQSPEEIIRIFQEAGGSVSNTVMSHLDRTLIAEEDLAEFASLGSFCEMDLFGIEVSHYQQCEETDMPSDAQRIARLSYLVDEGFSDKIVISHDIHTRHRLMKFGGHGYSHILINVVPKMLNRGITQEEINKFLVENPKNWLTYQ